MRPAIVACGACGRVVTHLHAGETEATGDPHWAAVICIDRPDHQPVATRLGCGTWEGSTGATPPTLLGVTG